MTDRLVTMTLSPSEERLIKTLRDIPESKLRDRVHRLMDELVTFVQFPRCDQIQADGVPCHDVDSDCDQCAHLAEMLERIVKRTAP